MSIDTERRESTGVVCSLEHLPSGKVRVVLDDVHNTAVPGRGPWKHDVLFTFKDHDKTTLETLELSETELADFGLSVLSRLVALSKA